MARLQFEDHKPMIGRLVQSVDTDHTKWNAAKTTQILSDFFNYEFFTVNLQPETRDALSKLSNYATDVVRACTAMRVPADSRVQKSVLQKALRKDAFVSLEDIVAIQIMLKAIADNPDRRKLCGRLEIEHNGGSEPFTLPDNCVVPSLYSLKRRAFGALLPVASASRNGLEASKSLWGDNAKDYFHAIEYGGSVVFSGGRTRKKTCRVTKMTAEALIAGLVKFHADRGDRREIEEYVSDAAEGPDTGGFNYSEPMSPLIGNLLPPPPV